jgi:hypothetical protein
MERMKHLPKPGIIKAYSFVDGTRTRIYEGTLDLISLAFKVINSGMSTFVDKLFISFLCSFAIVHILTGNP